MFTLLYNVVHTFGSVDEILKFDHSNESYWIALSCSAVYYGVQGGSIETVDKNSNRSDHSNENHSG